MRPPPRQCGPWRACSSSGPDRLSSACSRLAVSRKRQRERLAAAGVPQPRSLVCRSLAEMTAAAKELGYPVVVEARHAGGERVIELAPDRKALTDAAADALAESRGDYCLVEELVGGRIVTVNGFSLEGRFVPLTVTDRRQAPRPAFGVALAHLWPVSLEPDRIGPA